MLSDMGDSLVASGRRDFLRFSGALGVAALIGCRGSEAPPAWETSADATSAVSAIAAGQVSVESVMQTWIAGIERAAPLNAFISVDGERALEQARRLDRSFRRRNALPPLFGLPLVLKDVYETAGLRTTYATRVLRDHVPQRSAAMVDTLVAAGAIVLAKTNCDELNFGSSSQDSAFGGVKNPYDVTRIPGGSSGGSAAAVGGGFVPLAFGADTTGSIRMPAALCGAVGYRPSTGRYSGAGIWPISPSLDAAGPMSRSVRDLILIDSVLCPGQSALVPANLQGLRMGVIRDPFYRKISDPAVREAAEKVLAALQKSGVAVVEVEFPRADLLAPMSVAYPILLTEARKAMESFIAQRGIPFSLREVYEGFTPAVRGYFDQFVFAKSPPFDRDELARKARELSRAYDSLFDRYRLDFLAAPTTPFRAPKIGQSEIFFDGKGESPMDVIENMSAASSVAGLPGVSLPVGSYDIRCPNLPIGMLFEGRRFGDRALLASALAIEPVLARL
jgi:mandelamide amidase